MGLTTTSDESLHDEDNLRDEDSELAQDLSDVWVVQVQLLDELGEETEAATFGPMRPNEAWRLVSELEEQTEVDLSVELIPVFSAGTAEEILDFFFDEDEDSDDEDDLDEDEDSDDEDEEVADDDEDDSESQAQDQPGQSPVSRG